MIICVVFSNSCSPAEPDLQNIVRQFYVYLIYSNAKVTIDL